MNSPAPRLLAITPPAGPVEPDLVAVWLDAGARVGELAVLLREPGLPGHGLLVAPRLVPLRERAARLGLPCLISLAPDELDDALLEGIEQADPPLAGVQLKGDPSPTRLAELRPRVAGLLGRSCHGAPQPGDAWVDYTVLAPIFAPRTVQPGVDKPPIGLAMLRRWATPERHVLALGGVEPADVPALLAAGASGIAGISLFFSSPREAAENVATLVRLLADARERHVPPPR